MKTPHDVLLLRCAPPNNDAGTPIPRTIFTLHFHDNDVDLHTTTRDGRPS